MRHELLTTGNNWVYGQFRVENHNLNWRYKTKILSVNQSELYYSQDTNTAPILKLFALCFLMFQSPRCFFETEHWTLWFKLWGINIPTTLLPYCRAMKIEVETLNLPLRPSLEWRRRGHDYLFSTCTCVSAKKGLTFLLIKAQGGNSLNPCHISTPQWDEQPFGILLLN